MIYLQKKETVTKLRTVTTYLVQPANGKGRLRRSLDACALEFIVLIFVGATSFALYCNLDIPLY